MALGKLSVRSEIATQLATSLGTTTKKLDELDGHPDQEINLLELAINLREPSAYQETLPKLQLQLNNNFQGNIFCQQKQLKEGAKKTDVCLVTGKSAPVMLIYEGQGSGKTQSFNAGEIAAVQMISSVLQNPSEVGTTRESLLSFLNPKKVPDIEAGAAFLQGLTKDINSYLAWVNHMVAQLQAARQPAQKQPLPLPIPSPYERSDGRLGGAARAGEETVVPLKPNR